MSPRLGTSNMVREALLSDIRFLKKQILGSLNAARDLWFYSALPNVLLRLHLGRECYGLSIQPAVGIL